MIVAVVSLVMLAVASFLQQKNKKKIENKIPKLKPAPLSAWARLTRDEQLYRGR